VWFAAAGGGIVSLVLIGKTGKGERETVSTFRAERALPSEVFGPRDVAPLRRLASARALLIGTAARGAAPMRDMAGSLGWRWRRAGGWGPAGGW